MDWLSTALGRRGIVRLGIADGLFGGLHAICVWESEILIFVGGFFVVNVVDVVVLVVAVTISSVCSTCIMSSFQRV